MKTKHTPGPWNFIEQGDPDEFVLLANEHRWVIALRMNGELRLEEEIANASLIAAAPELLEALDDIIGLAEAGRMVHVINRAKAAIAKAKGEQP